MAMPAPDGNDLALWAADQARLLREGRLGEIDTSGLADVVERLGTRQGEALRDRLAALVARLLMWKFLPGARLPVWRADIAAERQKIARLLAASPSLAGHLQAAFPDAYSLGRLHAAAQAGIDADILPDAAPFTLDETRDGAFMPLEPGLELYRRASQR